uniref:Uncharacterized protein n=1 Tax=Plectus sambesii TaxID=2011161 RepID=A0A914XN81_9BILA
MMAQSVAPLGWSVLPFVLSLVTILCNGAAIFCPSKCACPKKDVVICNGTELMEIPMDWPDTLRVLSITHSPLKTLTTNGLRRYSRLEKLKLDWNELETIEKFAFRGLKKLRLLSVQNNMNLLTFGRFSFSDIRSESSLEMHLQDNGVEEIERNAFSNNQGIRKLDLRGNPVRRLRHHSLSGLNQTDFLFLPADIERIDQQAFFNTTRVHLLQIEEANLTDTGLIPHTFDGLEHVTSLVIKQSRLGDLHAEAFAGIETVHYVRITDSQITRVHRAAFANMHNVGVLEVIDNRIALIDRNAFDGHTVQKLRFENNRIHCSCANMWMLTDTRIPRDMLAVNYCMSPARLENRALIDIGAEYARKCPVVAAQQQLTSSASGTPLILSSFLVILLTSFPLISSL